MKKKILVVDDDASIVKLLTRGLEKRGKSTVRGVTDPRQAVPVAREFLPDLAILDIDKLCP